MEPWRDSNNSVMGGSPPWFCLSVSLSLGQSLAKKTIMKYGKIDDPKLAEGSYDYFAPYWASSLSVRSDAIQAQFAYMDEKEFPLAKNTDAREFFDNSFVDYLAKSGFLQKIGMSP